MQNLVQQSGPKGWPQKHENSKIKLVLDERLRPSEAIDLSAKLLSQFPNCKAESGFIESLSKLLASYPAPIARRIVEVRDGVARQTEFLTLAVVTAWCESRSKPLYEEVAYLNRVSAQIEAREQELSPSEIEHRRKMAEAWIKRIDPVAKRLTGNDDILVALREDESGERMRASIERRSREIKAEWGELEAPTLAGIPISVELARLMSDSNEAR